MLGSSGVDVEPEELTPLVWIPDRRGSLQAELLAASRRYGRLPYVLPPRFPALLAEVAAGRPVLVLQNLGVRRIPAWHYAVVVGFSPEKRQLILRSGTDERRVVSSRLFARTWARSDNWAAVLLRPGELPEDSDSRRFVGAAAAAESSGEVELAEAAYRAAGKRWPGEHLAWLGRGNIAFGRGEYASAASHYRQVLDLRPGNRAALNNLATVLARQGRCREAQALLDESIDSVSGDSAAAEFLAQSRAGLSGC